MAKLRKCEKCGAETLVPISKKMAPTHSTTSYECSSCGFKVEITPAASLGMHLTIYAIVAAFLWLIFFAESYSNSLLSIITFWAAMAILPALAVLGLWQSHKNPEVPDSPQIDIQDPINQQHALKRPIDWLEGKNTLIGLLAPIILIVAVLGLAAIIGFINFTYF